MADIINHAGDLKAAARSHRVDHTFTEKIMLAVTQVNGCRYCSYGHTKAALKEGIPEDEIARIAAGELINFRKRKLSLYSSVSTMPKRVVTRTLRHGSAFWITTVKTNPVIFWHTSA